MLNLQRNTRFTFAQNNLKQLKFLSCAISDKAPPPIIFQIFLFHRPQKILKRVRQEFAKIAKAHLIPNPNIMLTLKNVPKNPKKNPHLPVKLANIAKIPIPLPKKSIFANLNATNRTNVNIAQIITLQRRKKRNTNVNYTCVPLLTRFWKNIKAERTCQKNVLILFYYRISFLK